MDFAWQSGEWKLVNNEKGSRLAGFPLMPNGAMLTLRRRAVLTARNGWLLFSAETGGAMVCPEKTRLQDVFAAAIDQHAKIVKALHSATGVAFDKALKDAAS